MMNNYTVILKNGIEMKLQRNEAPGQSAVGLWVWSKRQVYPVVISFAGTSVDATEIVAITKEDVEPDTNKEIHDDYSLKAAYDEDEDALPSREEIKDALIEMQALGYTYDQCIYRITMRYPRLDEESIEEALEC